MKIGLLLPSLLMSERFSHRIFAPKPLLLALADGLVDLGHQVYFYSASDLQTKAKLIGGDKILESQDLPSVKVRYDDRKLSQEINYKISYYEYEADLTMKAFLHAEAIKLDVMHAYHDFLSHYFARLVPDLPVVYTLHDPLFTSNTIEGWRFDHFPNDIYVAISRHQARHYMDKIRIEEVVYHGVDIETFPFKENPDNYMAFIGRIIPEKGVKDAIKAALETQKNLHIATSENYFHTSYYKEQIAPLLNTPLIAHAGFMKKDKLTTWLKKAKALLFPSVFEEPFGMAMIEAMACGTPVIAYNNGSVPEVIVDGVTGFIVEPEINNISTDKYLIKKKGIEGLKEAIERIYSMSEKDYGRMRLSTRQHVEKNFSEDKMVKGYEKVYKSVLSIKY